MDVSREKNGLILPQFPGIDRPTIDFDDVRSGKRSRVGWYDLDLTNTRSIAAGSAILLQIAGNSFFIDQFLSAGFATAYFQDTNLSAKGAPIYVGPGFIARVPFTQILFENIAQVGKTLRIIYGIDVDFLPGLSAQAQSTIINTAAAPVPVNDVGVQPGVIFGSSTVLAAATPQNILAAASNTNGFTLFGGILVGGGAAAGTMSLLAKATAPASDIDGNVLVMTGVNNSATVVGFGGAPMYPLTLPKAIKQAAGLRIDAVSSIATTAQRIVAAYTLN